MESAALIDARPSGPDGSQAIGSASLRHRGELQRLVKDLRAAPTLEEAMDIACLFLPRETSSLTALRGALEQIVQSGIINSENGGETYYHFARRLQAIASTALAVSRVPPITNDDLTRTGELAADRPPQPASSNGKAWFLFIEEPDGVKRPATPEEIYEFSQIMIAIAPQEWAQGLWQKPTLPPVDA